MTVAYISLGSNLHHPPRQLHHALRLLCASPHHRLLAASRRYRNPAVGPGIQPDYANAVIALSTRCKPSMLLSKMQMIERRLGRGASMHQHAARVIDLDLLLYRGRRSRSRELCLPHPRLESRRFALQPLLDIAPTLRLPGPGMAAAQCLRRCPPHPMRRLWPDAARSARRWRTPHSMTFWSGAP